MLESEKIKNFLKESIEDFGFTISAGIWMIGISLHLFRLSSTPALARIIPAILLLLSGIYTLIFFIRFYINDYKRNIREALILGRKTKPYKLALIPALMLIITDLVTVAIFLIRF